MNWTFNRANNSQQCWMLNVGSVCTPRLMLLHVVGSRYAKFETGQLPKFLLFCNRRRVAQQCWVRLHRYSDIAGATLAHYTWSSHDALQVPILLGVVAHFRTPLLTRTQQLSTLLAQQCWDFKKSLCHQATVQNHSLINKHSVQKQI